jgi:putative spermidine/putrescine transport system ATP-binding protein
MSDPAEAFFVMRGLAKSFGPTIAVKDVSLSVEKGEFIALLGPSGCGKTSTLRMIAGFVAPSAGEITVAGRDITALPPNRRNMGMVFQNYALFPHMTVWGNVEFGLKSRRIAAPARAKQIGAILELVGLGEHARRYPRELSGGQQQRVALARVLVLKPDLLLFDEPLSNLDAKLRVRMRHEIRTLQQQIGVTALFVTHDQDEAMTMADRIVVMSQGEVQQVGTPREIYDQPRTRFVADFIGAANFIEGAVVARDGGLVFCGASGSCFPLGAGAGVGLPSQRTLAIRPEKIEFLAAGTPDGLDGMIRETVLLGPVTEYVVELRTGESLRVQDQRRAGYCQRSIGEAVTIGWPPGAAVVLPSLGQAAAGGS